MRKLLKERAQLVGRNLDGIWTAMGKVPRFENSSVEWIKVARFIQMIFGFIC